MSTTAKGEPVYGTYTARLSLLQSGAVVSGTYSTDIGIGGRIVAGTVHANQVDLTVSTSECQGTLRWTGTVRQAADGGLEMDVEVDGETSCAGERVESGTLARR